LAKGVVLVNTIEEIEPLLTKMIGSENRTVEPAHSTFRSGPVERVIDQLIRGGTGHSLSGPKSIHFVKDDFLATEAELDALFGV